MERLSQAARADGNSCCAIAFLKNDGSRTVLIQGLERGPVTPCPLDQGEVVASSVVAAGGARRGVAEVYRHISRTDRVSVGRRRALA